MKKLSLILQLILSVSNASTKSTLEKIKDEYNPDYCHLLEAAYGTAMMSEGGYEAIDHMFKNLDLNNKKALDIGSGLGGVAYYLAQKHGTEVTGLKINPWMVEESMCMMPAELKNKLAFVESTTNDHLPFPDNSFDIVYSKGVFCHIEQKENLIKECYRVLKSGGVLIINDWLSPFKGTWGSCIQRLVELEGLSLYAETIDGYLQLLSHAQFKEIEYKDCSQNYGSYNENIVENLKTPRQKESFLKFFNEKLYNEALEGYSSIAQAMKLGETIVAEFHAYKESFI